MAVTKSTKKKPAVKAKTAVAKKKSAVRLTPPRPKPAAKAKPAARKAAKPVKKIAAPKKKATVLPKKAAPPKKLKKVVGYSKQDLSAFRELIIRKIQEANEELVSIEERLVDATSGEYADEDSTYSMHMAEQGTDAMEREKAFLFASRERKFISHLEDALQRIAGGIYGVCIKCGNLIEKGRLEAVPHARMCINCKNDSKKGEHDHGGL
jgi:RNA polymerase-binding transcription factor DksA